MLFDTTNVMKECLGLDTFSLPQTDVLCKMRTESNQTVTNMPAAVQNKKGKNRTKTENAKIKLLS